MDYKKIIKSEKTRYAILGMLDVVPDRLMVQLQYRIKTGRKLNLRQPERYSEKLQWLKLYYRNPLMPVCADKASVREYVKSRGLAGILNEDYGIYDSAADLDWDRLPDQFVIKDTLGSGGRSMLFVYSKDRADKKQLEAEMKRWLSISPKRKNLGREWLYENRRHRLIVEKLLVSGADGDLPDYKFFCFHGKVYCSYMMQNYTMHHEEGVLGFLDRDFRLLPAHRADFRPMTEQPEKPKNYEAMVEMAEKLAEGFPHVRVDFYNLDGRIIFGEMTFFNASGYVMFEPDAFDFELGKELVLPERNHGRRGD